MTETWTLSEALPSWCCYSLIRGGEAEGRKAEQKARLLLATLQQLKLTACWQTFISHVCNCLPQLHLSQRPPSSPQMPKAELSGLKGKRREQIAPSLTDSPHTSTWMQIFISVIYIRLPSSLELLHPFLPQGDNRFAPSLCSPYSWQSDKGQAILQQPLIWQARTNADMHPPSRRHSSFCIFMTETNKTEAVCSKLVCLSPTLPSSGFFSGPQYTLVEVWFVM